MDWSTHGVGLSCIEPINFIYKKYTSQATITEKKNSERKRASIRALYHKLAPL